MATLVEHHSQDVDDQAKSLSGGWQQRYEQLSRGRFQGSAWQMVMADGVLFRETTNRGLREQTIPPPDHVVLAVPLAVVPGSLFAGRPFDRESLMVLSGQDEYEVVSAGELDLIGLMVHRDVFESTLAPDKVEWLQRVERERRLALPPDVASAIRQLLMAVCSEAERNVATLAEREDEAALLSSTLTQTVLLAMAGDRAEHGSTIPRRADSRLKVVRRAIEFMRANLQDDIGIPEICTAACASRRSLQYCFEEFMRTTPQAYLRALRLNEARRSLKARADQPIASLANALGFSSSSHFTRHYKAMFDELPSDTLKLHCYGPTVV